MERASKRPPPTAHISISRTRGDYYAQFRYGNRKTSLGRYDRSDPVGLLNVILQAAGKLTDYELLNLLRCDKSQREPNRGPGRRRKYQRI